MPCIDQDGGSGFSRFGCGTKTSDYGLFRENSTDKRKREMPKAIACGLIAALINAGHSIEDISSGVNLKEMGITAEELKNWWEEHQKQDKTKKD